MAGTDGEESKVPTFDASTISTTPNSQHDGANNRDGAGSGSNCANLDLDSDLQAALQRLKFRCVIIGAGPAGVAPLIAAARSHILPDLVEGSDEKAHGGVLLVDSCPVERFGSFSVPISCLQVVSLPPFISILPVVFQLL